MEFRSKTDKITRVLMLYHRLLNGQHINKSSFSLEHGINERSFDRDIEDVRLFLSEIFSASELLFDKETDTYYLTGDKPRYMDRMDVAIIAKLLLSTEALRHDEMMGLFDALLSTASSNDAKAVREYLHRSSSHYSSQTESALLKTLGDLYAAIHNGTDIELTFRSDDGERITKQVAPLEIDVEDSAFYLIGAEAFNHPNIVRYPVCKIERFTSLQTNYAMSFREKYQIDRR